jgi:hypothetical protein
LLASTDGELLVDTCYFSGNRADSGGAIGLSAADNVDKPVQFNITRSVFDGNSAISNGNAMYVTSGILTLTHSTVRNHVYKQHEAVLAAAAVTYVSDSLFHDNIGGAILTSGASGALLVIIDRSDFTNNDAPDVSSAIQAQGASLYLSEVRVQVNTMMHM